MIEPPAKNCRRLEQKKRKDNKICHNFLEIPKQISSPRWTDRQWWTAPANEMSRCSFRRHPFWLSKNPCASNINFISCFYWNFIRFLLHFFSCHRRRARKMWFVWFFGKEKEEDKHENYSNRLEPWCTSVAVRPSHHTSHSFPSN